VRRCCRVAAVATVLLVVAVGYAIVGPRQTPADPAKLRPVAVKFLSALRLRDRSEVQRWIGLPYGEKTDRARLAERALREFGGIQPELRTLRLVEGDDATYNFDVHVRLANGRHDLLRALMSWSHPETLDGLAETWPWTRNHWTVTEPWIPKGAARRPLDDPVVR